CNWFQKRPHLANNGPISRHLAAPTSPHWLATGCAAVVQCDQTDGGPLCLSPASSFSTNPGRKKWTIVSFQSAPPRVKTIPRNGNQKTNGNRCNERRIRPAQRVLAWHLRPLQQGDGNGRQGYGY